MTHQLPVNEGAEAVGASVALVLDGGGLILYLRPVFARVEIDAQAQGQKVCGKKEIQHRILGFATQNKKADRAVKEEFCFHGLTHCWYRLFRKKTKRPFKSLSLVGFYARFCARFVLSWGD